MPRVCSSVVVVAMALVATAAPSIRCFAITTPQQFALATRRGTTKLGHPNPNAVVQTAQVVAPRLQQSSSSNNDEKDSSSDTGLANGNKDPAVSGITTTKTTKDISNYYLLWSPGVLKKTVIETLVVLAAVMLYQANFSKNFAFFKMTAASSAHGGAAAACHTASSSPSLLPIFGRNVVLPLAASSCCLLQLGLNLLNFGCAGWNTKLGPLRPYFLSLLLVVSLRPPLPSLAGALWRISVALLPEVVHVYNEINVPSRIQQWFSKNSRAAEGDDTPTLHVVDLHLDIPTMGCVGCIQTINKSLRQQDHVVSASAELKPEGEKGGRATIRLRVPVDDDDDSTKESTTSQRIQELIKVVAKAGFPGASGIAIQKSSSSSDST